MAGARASEPVPNQRAPSSAAGLLEIGGRQFGVSNLDKVLWPATGTTKGDMVGYYAEVAPVLVPHLVGRAITMKRYPNGVDKGSFFEKNCPSHKPPWVSTVKMGDVNYCLVEEPATVVWMANLASIEIHPTLGAAPDLNCPTSVVFDLDPGEPAAILECTRVAFLLKDLFAGLGLQLWAKTSGSKGLQLYAPLNTPTSYEQTAPFAKAVAQLLEQQQPQLVISYQQRSARAGKVLIDWSQNAASKTTVAVYSMRARPAPTVSTPVTWDELEDALAAGDAQRLSFTWDEVLERVREKGDLMEGVLTVRQELPQLV